MCEEVISPVSDHCRCDLSRLDQIRDCLGVNIQYDSETNPSTRAFGPVISWQACWKRQEERPYLVEM